MNAQISNDREVFSSMTSVAIAVTKHADEFRRRILSELENASSRGLFVDVEEARKGNTVYFGMNFNTSNGKSDEGLPSHRATKDSPSTLISKFKLNLALAVSEVIVDHWERSFLKKLVARQYLDLEPDERETIVAYAQRNVDLDRENAARIGVGLAGQSGAKMALGRARRKMRIAAKILEYLQTNDELNIEGFVFFRMKDYVEQLQDAVDQAAEEFLAQKEYEGMLDLLAEIVQVQAPRLDVVHVYLYPGRIFRLKDSGATPLDQNLLEDSGLELIGGELAYEDVLVSALVVLAPSKVVLHCKRFVEGEELAELVAEPLRAIFQDRFVVCNSCQWCTPSRRH